MKMTSPDSEMREFYSRHRLPDDQAGAILAAAAIAKSAKRWKRVSMMAGSGLVLMTIVALTLYLQQDTAVNLTPQVAETQSPQRETLVIERQAPKTTERNDDQPTNETLPQTQYRLVAFRSHNDSCPYCRATGQVYQQLASSLKDTDVRFEQFHLGDVSAQHQNAIRIGQLQLEKLIAGRAETAFLALTSDDGVVLREFKPSLGSPRIATQLRELVNSSSAQ